jgi:peptidoglycan/LPS O-acetylase OafA/YrhL
MKVMSQVKQHSYRPEIDGIRALAVVAVIANHFSKDLLPSGYLGVDIFFVISGFVITSSLANRPSKNFLDFLVGFYTRRTKRLIPALVMFVLITSILICLVNPNPYRSLMTGVTSLFGLSNLFLFKQSTDYFAASSELNVFTHTWSLGVEEQFYFLYPFLAWFTGFARQTTTGSRNLFWVIMSFSAASLIAFVYIYQTNQPAAYFLMPTRLWEMGVGCLLFLGLKHSNKFILALESIPPLMVVGAVVATLFIPLQFALQATIVIVLLTATLITCLRSATAAYKLFTHPQVVYVGLISYSLYLWHWGVLSLSRWTIGIHWWSAPFQVVLILLLSIASYRYIETPLRRLDWSRVRWKSIVYGIAISTTTAALIFILAKTPNFSLYTGQMPPLVEIGVDSLRNSYSLKEANSLWRGDKCVLSGNSQVGNFIAVEDCTLGNFSNAKKRVLVLGNSFAPAFTQAFDELVVSDRYSVTIVSSLGASPVKEISNTSTWGKANNYYWNSITPSLINRLRTGDWVFLINDLDTFSPKHKTSETNARLKQLESGLESLSNKLSANGIRLAILHGIPFAREANCQPVAAAKQWFSPFGGPCKMPNRSESLFRRDALDKVLVTLAGKGRIRVVDIFNIFCPGKECTYNAKNGQYLYRDEYSHPSVEGVRLASPSIRKVLIAK